MVWLHQERLKAQPYSRHHLSSRQVWQTSSCCQLQGINDTQNLIKIPMGWRQDVLIFLRYVLNCARIGHNCESFSTYPFIQYSIYSDIPVQQSSSLENPSIFRVTSVDWCTVIFRNRANGKIWGISTKDLGNSNKHDLATLDYYYYYYYYYKLKPYWKVMCRLQYKPEGSARNATC